MNDPRNIGIGPAGRAFMGALLRLGDALEEQGACDSDSGAKREDPRSRAEAAGPQSGRSEAKASPKGTSNG